MKPNLDILELNSIHKMVDNSRQRMNVAAILTEIGAQASSSIDTFRKTIGGIGLKIDEEQVAGILIAILPRSDPEERKMDLNPWNLEVVAEVLHQECRGFNWALVAKCLDNPSLNLKTESDIQLLARLFVRVSGSAIPAVGILGAMWNNKPAQLIVLSCLTGLPRNIVDFSTMISAEQLIPGEIATPPNFSWLCIPLYMRLIDLANAGLPMEVLEIMSKGATAFPEYFLVSLAQVQDPNSGVRSEFLRRLLPLFTGLQGSRPSSLAVMRKLSVVNPELLIILCRIAVKKAKKVWEVANIDALLKGLGLAVSRRLEEEGSADELLSLWCVKADRLELSLEDKVQSLLDLNPKNARLFVSFAKVHAESLRPRTIHNQNDSILSFESFATLLRAVQAHPSIVPMEEVRALANLFAQQQQSFQTQQHQQQMYSMQGQNVSHASASNHTVVDHNDNNSYNNGNVESTELSRLPPGPEAEEIEALANSYFQKIYTADFTISDVILMLRQFKSSSEKREQEIFRCMIHNLFDEYRFFHKYPEKELQVTGRLFGALIQHQLVSSITLGIALRYVLEALRKDPELGEGNDKMFRFGRIALDQFRLRLGEWPQYCSHLVQIPHLLRNCPDMYQEIQKALNNPQVPSQQTSQAQMQQQQQFPPNQISQQHLMQQHQMMQQMPQQQMSMNNIQSVTPSIESSMSMQQMHNNNLSFNNSTPSANNSHMNGNVDNVHSMTQQFSIMNTNEPLPPPNSGPLRPVDLPTGKKTVPTDSQVPEPSVETTPVDESTLVDHSLEIARMAIVNADVLNSPMPPDNIRDQIHFIVNNIAKNNYETKSNEIKEMLKPEYFNWFANYLVVKRISTQPNLHQLYLSVLDVLDLNPLVKLILDSSYHNVTKLLQSPNITTSSSERSLLRNLGVWLGQLTLARNRPLLQKRINLKELLFWGFETGRLIAVCSFVAKIIEGIKESKIFKPPNPWLMALLGIMRELYEIEDLKLNIKFEVQVLCKNINIKIDNIPKGNYLSKCKMPVKDQRNPDFTLKPGSSNPGSSGISNSSPIVMQSTPAVLQQHTQQAPTPLMLPTSRINEEESAKQFSELPAPASVPAALPPSQPSEAPPSNSLNQLAPSITISPTLLFFATNPNQRRLVLIAVERGIKEIIQSAVERSVSIASNTTKQIILKDFSTEPNEQILRSGAHLMVSSLAGSLALATCKEPLRISIGNHLRTLLAQAISDQTIIEQIVQVCSNDNVDVGSALIEKASIDKSIREIDEVLAASILSRRKHRETGQQFVDTTIPTSGKYPAELHESLKPRVGGLLPQQLQIYEAFQRVKIPAPSQSQAQPTINTPSPSSTVLSQTGSIDAMKSLPPVTSTPMITMSQALEAYQGYLAHIDIALKAVQMQAQGRDVSISMLGTDHELLTLMRNLTTVTQRIQPNVRIETAITFSENLFNRMFESINSPDSLRLEIFVLMLETIKESCGGSKVFNPDFISWLGKYAVLVSNDEVSRRMYRLILVLLLRAKLLRPNDIDMYFLVYIDAGRNLFWLELALSFIRQCLVEGLATIYDFTNTFETVTKMRPTNMVLKKQLQKWLTDIKTLTVAQEEQKAAAAANGTSGGNIQSASSLPPTAPVGTSVPATVVPGAKDPVREHVTLLLDRWLRVWNAVTDQIFSQYLQLMHQYGVLKTEEAADKFFRCATEICTEACVKNVQPSTSPDQPASLNYTVIDALSKLFLLLVRLADKEATDMNVRVNLLSRILNAVARTLIEDHESKKSAKVQFDQRPYFRLLSNLSQDLGVPEAKQEVNPAMFPLLTSYTQTFLALQPSVVPGFAYAWVQLISRRSFMPNLLLIKGQKGWLYMHRLLSGLLQFLQPFLRASQMNESIRKLYKGTLRILLVLLHDFPEFLCDFHLSFCDLIPLNCVQLRNLILSAFPRSMRLPDPFTPNLKIDVLPEISQSPRILTDYLAPIAGIRTHIDTYLSTKLPAELPLKLPTVLTSANGSYNSALITSLVIYIGTLAIMQVQNKIPIQNSPAMEIYKQLAIQLDAEGKYILFNIMANQLRYPNSHTHFFSFVILNLFLEAENEQIQEQITRVLLERLIVHRPHPVISLDIIIKFINIFIAIDIYFLCTVSSIVIIISIF